MILGRPVNLWNGLVTALGGFVATVALIAGADPAVVAQLVAAGALLMGSTILLVANQPPSVNVGDSYTVVTPGDAPNVEKEANAFPTPPANLVDKGPLA